MHPSILLILLFEGQVWYTKAPRPHEKSIAFMSKIYESLFIHTWSIHQFSLTYSLNTGLNKGTGPLLARISLCKHPHSRQRNSTWEGKEWFYPKIITAIINNPFSVSTAPRNESRELTSIQDPVSIEEQNCEPCSWFTLCYNKAAVQSVNKPIIRELKKVWTSWEYCEWQPEVESDDGATEELFLEVPFLPPLDE